jgi:hypothetical protein
VSEQPDNRYLALPTADGGHVLLYVDAICSSFGVYGIRINALGNLEGLVIGPDRTEWKELEELPVVQAGSARPSRARRS